MNLEQLRALLAPPMACLFLILTLCVFAIRTPGSTGIRIPMMRTRAVPLSNCEFNGFSVYLRSDGRLAGGERDDEIPLEVLLGRIKDARDNIQDATIFVIADRDVAYGQFAALVADIHNADPSDHLAVVTREAQVQPLFARTKEEPMGPIWADRCRFEWPAVKGQPKWPEPKPASPGRPNVRLGGSEE